VRGEKKRGERSERIVIDARFDFDMLQASVRAQQRVLKIVSGPFTLLGPQVTHEQKMTKKRLRG
jgi:hypothetical protein